MVNRSKLIAGTGIMSMVAVLALSPTGLDTIKQNEDYVPLSTMIRLE